MRFHKLAPEDVIVFHDELDLNPGKCRFKTGGGHAGHNGLRSLHAHIGAEYNRVRMGIGHPGHKDRVSGYVLADFTKADQEWLDHVIKGCSDGATALAAGDFASFGNTIGLRVNPPRSSSVTKPKPDHTASQKCAPVQEDTRSPIEKLRDKFR